MAVKPYSSPIFVCGTPRSGTTLTANVLGRSPGMFMSGENHFFETIYPNFCKDKALEDPKTRQQMIARILSIYGHFNQFDDQKRVDDVFAISQNKQWLDDAASSAIGAFASLMAIQTQHLGKLRWGNQTPKDIFYACEIAKYFEDSFFIVCLRDPRDFCLSYKNRYGVTTKEHKDRLSRLYHPILTAMLWRSTAGRALKLRKALGEQRVHIMRYEDIVAEPEMNFIRLCEKTGLQFEPQMLQVDSHNSSFEKGKTGIFSNSVGRWREKLPTSEVAAIQAVAGKLMQQLKYSLDESLSVKDGLSHFATFPAGAYRALQANKAHRGPLLRYLAKRLLPGDGA